MLDLVFANNRRGHVGSYVDTLCHILDAKPLYRGNLLWTVIRLLSARSLIFAGVDDCIPMFCVVSLVRSAVFRKTSGLFVRPHSCFEKGYAGRTKRMLFQMLRRNPKISVTSIIPFTIDRRIRHVARYWIYDPQLWDLTMGNIVAPTAPTSDLSEAVTRAGNGRQIVLFLGHLTPRKGFHSFVNTWVNNHKLRDSFLFVAAGGVSSACKQDAARFESASGYLLNENLSDSEMLSLYSAADLVWCNYSPSYDQASGIFGRAFQYGKTCLIRDGSRLSKLALQIGASFFEVEEHGRLMVDYAVPPNFQEQERLNSIKHLYDVSARKLRIMNGVMFG